MQSFNISHLLTGSLKLALVHVLATSSAKNLEAGKNYLRLMAGHLLEGGLTAPDYGAVQVKAVAYRQRRTLEEAISFMSLAPTLLHLTHRRATVSIQFTGCLSIRVISKLQREH